MQRRFGVAGAVGKPCPVHPVRMPCCNDDSKGILAGLTPALRLSAKAAEAAWTLERDLNLQLLTATCAAISNQILQLGCQ